MRRWLIVIGLSAGCPDPLRSVPDIPQLNSPFVTVRSIPPAVQAGGTVDLQLDASNGDGRDSLDYTLYVNGVVLCEGRGVPASCPYTTPLFGPLTLVVDALAINDAGGVGEAQTVVPVDPLDPPDVAFGTLDLVVPPGPYSIHFILDDDEDEATEFWLWSSIDGALVDGVSLLNSAHAFVVDLSAGIHELRAMAKDSDGMVGGATTFIHVVEPVPPAEVSLRVRGGPIDTRDPIQVHITEPLMHARGQGVSVDWEWDATSYITSRLPPLATTRGSVRTLTVTPRTHQHPGNPTTVTIEVGNAPPLIHGVWLTYSALDLLQCNATVRDADADTVQQSFEWNDEQGQLLGTGTSLDVSSHTGPVTCVVSADDLQGGVTTASATTTPGSTPPYISADITPTSPTVDRDLTASVTPSRALPLRYIWRINADVVQDDGLSSLAAGRHRSGDRIDLTVIADDGIDRVAYVAEPVWVANSPPTAPVVRIETVGPLGDRTFRCVIDEPAIDPDGDPISYTVTWNEGSLRSTVWLGDTVQLHRTNVDVLQCTVRATDGQITVDVSTQTRLPSCDDDEDGWIRMTPECGGQDCDDRRDDVHPRATDTPGDDVDHNCDGLDCDARDVDVYRVTCTEPVGRAAAEAQCASIGMRLAEVHTTDLQDSMAAHLFEVLRGEEAVWIGLDRVDDQWRWQSGRPVVLRPWTSGEGSAMSIDRDGQWQPRDGDAAAGFVCVF